MKLLFITQKVDKDDDILGVYHRWIEELAGHFEKIKVICLYQGRTELPANVEVYSLGKESGKSRLKYLFRFYKYLFSSGGYDKVFVHMNPEYVLLGGLFWKLLKKKIFFWYNHPMGGLKARIAIGLADLVFHTSPFAFAARYKKSKIMPVGVDTELFRFIPAIKKKLRSILYLGRISPIKNLEVLIEAALLLDNQGEEFQLSIIGNPSKKSEISYAEKIKNLAEPLVKKNKVVFWDAIPNYKVPEIYNAHVISVNMTPSGSFDKTIIEAMACGVLTLVSNRFFEEILPPELFFKENDANDLLAKLSSALLLSSESKLALAGRLRQYALRHDLSSLVLSVVKAVKY